MIELLDSTSRVMVDVKVVPDLLQVIALRARLEDLDGVPVININEPPLQGFNSVVKRAIDIAISGAALAVLAVPLALIALVIKATSRGPVFYRQERMGLDGKSFSIVKFRSMFDDAERRYRTGVGACRATRASRRSAGSCGARTSTSFRSSGTCSRATCRIVGPRPERPHLRRAVQAPDSAVHAAPQGEGRADGLGAGERLARQHAAREAHRVPTSTTSRTGPSRLDLKIMWLTLVRGFFHKHAY